jgi:hypothetical protein
VGIVNGIFQHENGVVAQQSVVPAQAIVPAVVDRVIPILHDLILMLPIVQVVHSG